MALDLLIKLNEYEVQETLRRLEDVLNKSPIEELNKRLIEQKVIPEDSKMAYLPISPESKHFLAKGESQVVLDFKTGVLVKSEYSKKLDALDGFLPLCLFLPGEFNLEGHTHSNYHYNLFRTSLYLPELGIPCAEHKYYGIRHIDGKFQADIKGGHVCLTPDLRRLGTVHEAYDFDFSQVQNGAELHQEFENYCELLSSLKNEVAVKPDKFTLIRGGHMGQAEVKLPYKRSFFVIVKEEVGRIIAGDLNFALIPPDETDNPLHREFWEFKEMAKKKHDEYFIERDKK